MSAVAAAGVGIFGYNKLADNTDETLNAISGGRLGSASAQEYSPKSEFIEPRSEPLYEPNGVLATDIPISPAAYNHISDSYYYEMDMQAFERLSRQEQLIFGSAGFDFYEETAAHSLREMYRNNQMPHLPGEELPSYEKFARAHIDNTGQEILNQITLHQYIATEEFTGNNRKKIASSIFNPESELVKYNDIYYSEGTAKDPTLNFMTASLETNVFYNDTFLSNIDPGGMPTKVILTREHRTGVDSFVVVQFEETEPGLDPVWTVKSWLPFSEPGSPNKGQETIDMFSPDFATDLK